MLVLEFRLSEPVIARLYAIVDDVQAGVTHGLVVPGVHLYLFMAIQRLVRFCREPWGVARVCELADDMRRAKNVHDFDLAKLKLEAGATGGRLQVMNEMWKGFLEACREAAVEGREVELE